jgi:hypothetical protein
MWLVYARNRDLIGSSQIHRFKWRKSKGSNEWSGPEQVVRVSEIVAAVKRG